jgi:hypothetical protein
MYAAIEACDSLFLLDLKEPSENAVRVVVGGTSLGDLQDLQDEQSGDVLVRDVRPIIHRRQDPVFAIEWKAYVSYVVLNESFAMYDDTGPAKDALSSTFQIRVFEVAAY